MTLNHLTITFNLDLILERPNSDLKDSQLCKKTWTHIRDSIPLKRLKTHFKDLDSLKGLRTHLKDLKLM
jgi:hypothetical protein